MCCVAGSDVMLGAGHELCTVRHVGSWVVMCARNNNMCAWGDERGIKIKKSRCMRWVTVHVTCCRARCTGGDLV